MVYNGRIHKWAYSRFLAKNPGEGASAKISIPLQSFRVGLLKLLGNIDGASSYMDFVAMYMVKKLAGTVEKTFHMIDINKNGVLDRSELRKVLKKLGVSPESLENDVDTLLDEVDENRDGMVSLDEFNNWYINQKIRATSRIEKLFNAYDQDKDGFLNKTEFRALITAVNGCEPPSGLLDQIVQNVGSLELINLPNTVAWFESQNPINRKSIFNKRHSSVARGSVMPSKSKAQSSEKRSILEPNPCEGGTSLEEKDNTSLNAISVEKKISKTFSISADILSVGLDLDDTINISFPSGKGWKFILQWALTIPLVFPLYCTLYDVRKEGHKKYFGITFIGSII